MSTIACDQNVRPTLWIRLNPNGFKVDNVSRRLSRQHKNTRLLSMIQDTTALDGTRIVYMYYDIIDGMPTICQGPAYDQKVTDMFCPSIID